MSIQEQLCLQELFETVSSYGLSYLEDHFEGNGSFKSERERSSGFGSHLLVTFHDSIPFFPPPLRDATNDLVRFLDTLSAVKQHPVLDKAVTVLNYPETR